MIGGSDLVGKTAMDLVLELPRLQQPRAKILRFVVFTPYQGLDARLKLEPEVLAERRSVPEVLASKPAAELVAELLRHETNPTREIVDVTSGSVTQTRLDGLLLSLADGAALGLCSVTGAGDGALHVAGPQQHRWEYASALARIDPSLLTRSGPPPG